MPTTLCSLLPKWKLRSRPLLKPVALPCHWAKSLGNGMPRVVNTPRLRCMGSTYSSSRSALVIPTAMASCPMPLNHLLILPCLSRLSIFSSIMRGRSRSSYRSSSWSSLRSPRSKRSWRSSVVRVAMAGRQR